MNRTLVALLAALEAVVAVAIGIGVLIVPLTVIWAVEYHGTVAWGVFWRAASDIWLLGSGVNLTVSLPAQTATQLGLPSAAVPFQVTIAALGLALVIVLLGIRAGRRAAETPYLGTGLVFSLGAYGVLAAAITLSAGSAIVQPSVWQGVLLPMFVFAVGIAVGAGPELLAEGSSSPISDRISSLAPSVRRALGEAFRGGTIAAALILAVSGLFLAGLLLIDFANIVALYEQLQSGILGGIALTLGQLLFLPNLVIWTASWLIGPGFALGTGSSVSALGTQLGPVPSIPILGALPSGHLTFGFLGIIVPLLAGFVAAALLSIRRARGGAARPPIGELFLIAAGIGSVAGIELGLLAWWSSGSIGPGRLHTVGPDPWLTGLCAAAEVAVAAVIGMIAGGRARE